MGRSLRLAQPQRRAKAPLRFAAWLNADWVILRRGGERRHRALAIHLADDLRVDSIEVPGRDLCMNGFH
ncbi:MAG: hypothetical protein IPM70_18690 [Proteobacteria bacterium]|nr:hypothetical protein [Pseudomonadota bacterium]